MSSDGVIHTDNNGRALRTNRKASEILGYCKDEIRQINFKKLLFNHDLSDNQQEGLYQKYDVVITNKHGKKVLLNITTAKPKFSHPNDLLFIIQDLTRVDELTSDSNQDYLTSLNNRRYFSNMLKLEFNTSILNRRTFSILLVDIDNYKSINDLCGHDVGDAALRKVASFLKQNIAKSYSLARWGGDEFIILCPDTPPHQAKHFAEALRKKFEHTTINHQVPLSLSIGISDLSCLEVPTPNTIIESADRALYKAKERGKNLVVHYTEL